MRLSELILHLQNAENEHGDVPVLFAANCESDDMDDGDTVPIEGLAFAQEDIEDPHSAVEYVLICDIHTLDAFRDS